MFNLREEKKNIPWIEERERFDLRIGKTQVGKELVDRIFSYKKGKNHEMRYGGKKDVSYEYETISFTPYDDSLTIISMTQKYFADGEQDIEIDLDVIPDEATLQDQERRGLATGDTMPVEYSLHSKGVLPPLGSSLTGLGEEDPVDLLEQGLIPQLWLPKQIDVEATARNLLIAAKKLDFNLQPHQLLVPVAK